MGDGCGELQGSVGAVGLAFFEVVTVDGEGVGDVRDADHRGVSGGSKGVEGRGLHFDGVDAGSFSVCDRRRCFAEGSVGGPGRAEEDGLVEVVEPVAELVQQYRVEVGPLRGWEVMRLVPSSRRALSMIMKYGGSPSATTRPAEVMEMISAHPDARVVRRSARRRVRRRRMGRRRFLSLPPK